LLGLGVLLELGLAGITERLIELELLELDELLELGLPETTVRLGMGVVDVRVSVGAGVGVGVGVGGFSEIVGSALDFFFTQSGRNCLRFLFVCPSGCLLLLARRWHMSW